MPRTTAEDDAIAARREIVAGLLLRHLSQRAIVAELGRQGLVNPETGEPYSLFTVNTDVQALRRAWQVDARRKTAAHQGTLLAELRAVRAAAWDGAGTPAVVEGLLGALKDPEADVRAAAARSLGQVGQPDLASVLRSAKQEAELLGLDAPKKIAPTDPGGTKPYEALSDATLAAALDRLTTWEAAHDRE